MEPRMNFHAVNRGICFSLMTLAGVLFLPTGRIFAQGDEGFTHHVPATTVGNERARQPSLWVMEVDLKPMRVIWVDMPDPKTGEVKPELFHYLCYRAVNRPIEIPATRETEPHNRPDPEPGPPFFIPEFSLVPVDTDQNQVFLDAVIPEVVDAINRKERRKFKNSVTIVGPIPKPTKEKANDANALYGVAVFRGVDPQIDRFTVYMNGFSNGYEVSKGPDGEPLMLRKTIKQKFWRPGDQFDVESREIRFDGEPAWVFRPDAAPADK